jgi:membrane protein DedA with SNARE-associated domain
VVLPLAGFIVGRGDFTFWAALRAATIGATAGALVLYSLGWWGGRALVLRRVSYYAIL